ncbi:sugar phosphate isomerase/epimerase [Bifidobacterium sp. 64T4]|uniref:sugar phosphate isomerase/epimerase family protein n=1 Tax=Bifidobacterium pongonis TaxID=2834432 RepID=UPI001C584C65|nr:sugar phosphate isomerase/epimerase [Bifidobacterium pongonis]MBW3094737.1 sugar phosphate isomerase/epimerase [Bifidobacterium pongonis]
MTTIGINTLVYMDALRDGTPQSELLARIASHGITLAEVRREYITGDAEIRAIAKAAEDNHLTLFYSVPEPLGVNGEANPQLEAFLDEAERMGAANVKFNQGDIVKASPETIRSIDEAAAAHKVTLSVENDQTPENGPLAGTAATLAHIAEAGGRIGYTFDLGNWRWLNEDPQTAFDQLLGHITIFHLKNVGNTENGPATTMLQNGGIDWQPMLHRLPATVPALLEFPIPAQLVGEQVSLVRQTVAER